MTAACEKIYRAAIRKGIPVGHSTGYDPQGIRRWLDLGLSWIAVDGDWITLYRHASEVARRIREIQPASNPGGRRQLRAIRGLRAGNRAVVRI